MNRIMSFFALMLCYIASVAQNANEHLTFKGVPIDGTLNEYVLKMQSAGFLYLGSQDETAILKGDFAGFKGCLICVSTLNNSDIVNTISVIFPKKDDWSSLEENYKYLKNMLKEKYGKPSKCVEEFQGDVFPRSNSDKLLNLKMDRCTYVTIFETSKGNIQLSLESQEYTSHFVKLQYWDKINTDVVRANAIDDL